MVPNAMIIYIHQEKIKITPIAHLSIPSVILLINKLNHITHLMKKKSCGGH